ncbi:MAG: hypothetical protein WAS33_15710 [Candidatus Promineifilaceae bacterium]
MDDLQIKITNDGVLIPLDYLKHAREFELEVQNGDVLIRPKPAGEKLTVHERFPWIGIGNSSDPTASERVEEILAAEIDKRSGWTHKPPLDEESK